MKKVMILVLLLIGVLWNSNELNASSTNDVSIFVNSEKEQYSKQFDLAVTIKFDDTSLYNEKVFLSYHIYDNDGKEILWEGQRYPISINDIGISELNVTVDLMSNIEQVMKDNATLKFDLVDEKNVYWFSLNENINISTDEVVYTNDEFKRIVATLMSPVKNNPIIFAINSLFFIGFIVCFIRIRKSELFVS